MSKPLKGPNLINPFLLRSLPTEATVQDGVITIKDTILRFIGEPYPDGTKVRVSCPRNFQCESVEEINHRRQQLQLKKGFQTFARRQRRERESRKAKAFNRSLNIPVDWKPELKAVLSGLQSHSWGDGMRKGSVFHVLLLEDLKERRLSRQAGDFLCGADPGKLPDLRNLHNYRDRKISCKTCLKLTNRWK